MAIDGGSFSSYSYDLQREIENRTQKQIDKLRNAGVRVIDTRIMRKPRTEYIDYKILSKSGNQKIPTETISSYDYDIRYDLEVDDNFVSHFLDMSEKYKYFMNRTEEEYRKRQTAEHNAQQLEKRSERLNSTLAANPGIREQWEEMMVMLKMAGFDERH